MFQMPNYGLKEIGTFEQADFMQHVYVGITEVTDDDSDEYPIECEAGSLCNDLGDATGDGISDILDIVTIVNNILGSGRVDDAYKVNFYKTGDALEMEANGFVSAVQMTIKHDSDASFEFVSESLVSAYVTDGESTTFIMVVPEEGVLFNLNSENGFTVDDLKVANSSGLITSTVVSQFALMSSYPNPFNPQTTISFELFSDSHVDLAIYNMVGQKVATLMDGFKDNGSYDVNWGGTDSNGSELASGIYMVKLVTDRGVVTNKITLLK